MSTNRGDGARRNRNTPQTVKGLMKGWTTPMAHDGSPRVKGQKAKHGTKHGCADLNHDATLVGWPTPTMIDSVRGVETNEARKKRGANVGTTLNDAAALTGWATPLSRDAKSDRNTVGKDLRGTKGYPLSGQVLWVSGPSANSSPAQTVIPAGYQLNPGFSLWLLGYPIAWLSCGVRGIASVPSSRRSLFKAVSNP
jgi:hypothetical protein